MGGDHDRQSAIGGQGVGIPSQPGGEGRQRQTGESSGGISRRKQLKAVVPGQRAAAAVGHDQCTAGGQGAADIHRGISGRRMVNRQPERGARSQRQVVAEGERAQRIARGQHAAGVHRHRAGNVAIPGQCAAGGYDDRPRPGAAAQGVVDQQRAAADGGAAAVCVRPGEEEGAAAGFVEGDVGGSGQIAGQRQHTGRGVGDGQAAVDRDRRGNRVAGAGGEFHEQGLPGRVVERQRSAVAGEVESAAGRAQAQGANGDGLVQVNDLPGPDGGIDDGGRRQRVGEVRAGVPVGIDVPTLRGRREGVGPIINDRRSHRRRGAGLG